MYAIVQLLLLLSFIKSCYLTKSGKVFDNAERQLEHPIFASRTIVLLFSQLSSLAIISNSGFRAK